jgi:hypothetical protein
MKRGKRNRLDKARRKKRRRKEQRRAEVRKQVRLGFNQAKTHDRRVVRDHEDMLDSVGTLPEDSSAPR